MTINKNKERRNKKRMDLVEYIQEMWKRLTGKNEPIDYNETYNKINDIKDSVELPEKPDLSLGVKEYERIDYKPPTDEELENTAKQSLAEYANLSKASIENEIASLISKYETDKTNNEASYTRTLNALKSAYEQAKEEVNNDALKRGLARSSIAGNSVASIESEHANSKATAINEFEKKNAEIDAQISGLETKRQKAMDDFNISYTAKLTEEINKLKSERADNEQEAIKYNNSLAEKENKEKVDRAKAESDIYTERLAQLDKEREIKSNPTEVEQDKIYQQIYEVLRDKLLSMSALDAKEEIANNDIYSKYLSSAYYYKLYNEFGR